MKQTIGILALVATALIGCTQPSTDALVLREGTINSFPYHKGEVRISQHQTVTEPAQWPGLKVVETYYVNEGAPVTVLGYRAQEHQMKATDTVLWTLQPTSTINRLDWVLPVTEGFYKENYLGMNNSDYGGGIPMVDVWTRENGLAIGLLEPELHDIAMPVEWKQYDDHVSMVLSYTYDEPVILNEGDTLFTYRTFAYAHEGDFFNALRTFSEYMQSELGIAMPASEPESFEPVWCAWGYERTFTLDEVIGTLDKVAELGFRWVDVDDGYQVAEGDWTTNARFPGGDSDMRRLTDEIHKRGLKAKLWWAPLAADPGTQCLQQHPEMMLLTKDETPEYITWWNSYYLSPVNPATVAYTQDIVDRFLHTWNFDGLKIDGQHLNCCMPDYNGASDLADPKQSQEQLPSFFQAIYDTARALKPNAVVQICPCGCAVNYYLLPTFNQAVASDPTSSKQIRMKRKAYAAMAPQLAYYGDHVELSDGGNDFATQIGVGAVIGTKFTYPADNPNASESFLLTPEKEQLIKKWMKIYNDHNLARGEYLNLYSWGYDYPEAHVIRQNDALYYAFYADHFEGDIELRGLAADKHYTAVAYTEEDGATYEVDGAHPFIHANFDKNLLLKVTL
ncbi:MAG: alpha-galactosidase [Paludibacteraceae bacterium]|nr:alpha-galactosidase [Paludibacteraceae bacterium]